MRKVYYNPMRKLTLILPFLAVSLLAAEQGTSQQPSSLKATSLESHEGMTITARPWTDPALNLTLSEEDHQALYPLSSEGAADVITQPSTKNVTTKRLPIPLGGPKTGRDKKWTEVEQSMRDAGVQASVVAPHGTVQGLLYFDLRSQFELLNTAHLYVPEIVDIEKNRGLMYFEIDLSRSAER